MNKSIKLLKAFRINQDEVKCLYLHKETSREFLITWIKEDDYYSLSFDCLSESENLNERVSEAIKCGEDHKNPDLDLYLEIRDIFSSGECEDLSEFDNGYSPKELKRLIDYTELTQVEFCKKYNLSLATIRSYLLSVNSKAHRDMPLKKWWALVEQVELSL